MLVFKVANTTVRCFLTVFFFKNNAVLYTSGNVCISLQGRLHHRRRIVVPYCRLVSVQLVPNQRRLKQRYGDVVQQLADNDPVSRPRRAVIKARMLGVPRHAAGGQAWLQHADARLPDAVARELDKDPLCSVLHRFLPTGHLGPP